MSVQFLECPKWNFSENKILDKYFAANSSYTLRLVAKGKKCSRVELQNTASVEAAKEGKKCLALNPSSDGNLSLRFKVNNIFFKSVINRDGTTAANINFGTYKIHGHRVTFVANLATTLNFNPLLFRLQTRFPTKKSQSSIHIRRGERNGYHLGLRTFRRCGPLTLGADTSLNLHNIRVSQFNLLFAYKFKDLLLNLNHLSNPSHEGGLAIGKVGLNLTSRTLNNKVVSLNMQRNFQTKEFNATVGGRLKLRDNALLLGKVDRHLNTSLGGHVDFKNGLIMTLTTNFNPLNCCAGAKCGCLSNGLPFGLSLKYKI